MIRDYEQVIQGLRTLSEGPNTTRKQAELLKGAILVIKELQKDLRAAEWMAERLADALPDKKSGAGETDFASPTEVKKKVQNAPKQVGRPKKQASGSETPKTE